MAGRLTLAAISLGGVALVATAAAVATQPSLYTRAATRSCLLRLPHSIDGLPPANPPVLAALFVDALARDDQSTGDVLGPRPRAHKQLGAWDGGRTYEGIILSFFKSVPDARVSLKSLASLFGGERIRNVVATWDQPSVPSRHVRRIVLGCLRSEATSSPPPERPPPVASLATFIGRWGGHSRGLSITSSGRGSEIANDGCCVHSYRMTFQILSVRGTLTRANAAYRVTSFRRYDSEVPRLHGGEVGKLALNNGIVTNTLTRDFFCSDPAWGATNACGL